MSIFDKLKTRNQSNADDVVAFVSGERVPVSQIKDPLFSSEQMGKTVAIDPSSSYVVSPVNGIIESVFPTKHAYMIHAKNGIGYIIHIGIDTVDLKGDGFCALVKKGETVKAGQPIANVNFDKVKKAGLESTVMLIASDVPGGKEVLYREFETVKAGDKINL